MKKELLRLLVIFLGGINRKRKSGEERLMIMEVVFRFVNWP